MLPAAAERDVGQIEGRNAAVEVGHGLDCPVEKRGVGKHDGRTLLITRAIGIVFVVGELGRSSAHDEQETTVRAYLRSMHRDFSEYKYNYFKHVLNSNNKNR